MLLLVSVLVSSMTKPLPIVTADKVKVNINILLQTQCKVHVQYYFHEIRIYLWWAAKLRHNTQNFHQPEPNS